MGFRMKRSKRSICLRSLTRPISFCGKRILPAQRHFIESPHILREVEMKAAEEGRLIPGTEATLQRLRKEIKLGLLHETVRMRFERFFLASMIFAMFSFREIR